MLMWKEASLVVLLYLNFSYVLCDGTYECGDHGRFEYCIDEIPGCVVGCHCHPGYYFDTDTKICEPNSKLIEHNRRRYVLESTQIQNNVMTPNSIFITDPVSTTNKIDGAVDEISKDAEDLGDWLYNQFFKAIESQVINNTSDKSTFSRRSGSVQSNKKSKGKKRLRKRKYGKNNKKGKKNNLRKKLLRITENDSAFDLSSSSKSGSSDSTSGSSDSSGEYDSHDDEDEHGHKKIVMIKKKPKQLPNFIFLPNLETPFYPPLGLPPPPVPIPMYPMVPVPPMICNTEDLDDSVNETTAASTTTTTFSTSTTTPTTSTSSAKKLSNPSQAPDENKQESLRHSSKKRKQPIGSTVGESANDLRYSKLGSPNRQKILQRLKQKMQNQPAKSSLLASWNKNKKTVTNPAINQDVNLEYPYIEYTPDSNMINDLTLNAKEGSAVSDNVDFKYITELIHRVNQNNKSNNLPPIEYNPLDSIEAYQPSLQENKFSDYIIPPNAPDNRRFSRPNVHQSDELYYINLGRQIASMIRGIDTQNKEVNLKLETTHNIPKNDVYLNINSPKSYWERSVRSPLTFFKSNKKKFEYLKKSNELLFDIENKVEIIASTVPTLSLQEIENIVNIMEAKRGMHKNAILKNVIPPGKNLNINLWPRKLPKTRNTIPPGLSNFKNIVDFPISEHKGNQSYNIDNPDNLHRLSVLSTNRLAVQRYPQISKTNSGKKLASPINFLSKNYPILQHVLLDPKHTRPPFLDQSSRQSLWQNEMKPPFLKHRKYFNNIHNFLVNPIPTEPKVGFKRTNEHTSYFRHEFTNFDSIKK